MGSSSLSRMVEHRHLDGIDSSSSGPAVPRPWAVYGPGASGALQVTTSYRTGKRSEGGSSVEEDSDTALLSATNYRDRFKVMKEERRREPKSPLDNGHEFSTKKAYVSVVSHLHTRIPQGGGSWLGYDGPVWPCQWPSASFPNGTFKYMDPADLGWYGPRAISATIPTNPSTEVATALTELWREGIPLKPGTTVRREARRAKKSSSRRIPSSSAGSAGSEYLNVEFGWKPLIRDLQRTASAVKRSNKILRQHKRNSGKSIRRQYTFPEEKTFSTMPEVLGTLNCPSNNTAWKDFFRDGNPTGQMSESIETIRQVTFSGAYTYHVGEDSSGKSLNSLDRFEQKANLLLGTRITPEVVWNVAPWSWLADWRGNIGENISNATALAADGLVIRYGYLMVHSTVRHTYTLWAREKSNPDIRVPYTIEFVTETKERFRASPFGFGSNPASFTGRQWAILASLGMTRGDKALRLND